MNFYVFISKLPLKVYSLLQIPMNPPVSDGCRDLLQMLLRRDPHERMPFDHFFDHVFIDLEHLPGPECLTKAVSLWKVL